MENGRVAKAMGTLLVVLLAAGCADTPAGAPTDGLVATATTGVLRGVVVDQAIRPIEGATVTLTGPAEERSTTTDVNGTFGFAGLAPGTWFIEASKLAHTTAQLGVEVVAGVDDPGLAKLQLTFVPGELPFYSEVKMEAFVQCIVPGANLCAIINLYPCAAAGYCQPIVDDTSYILLYDHLVAIGRAPDLLQTEIVWETTQSVSPALSIRYSAYEPEGDSGGGALGDRQDRVSGESPLVYRLEPERLAEWETGTTAGIGHEFFGHTDQASAVGSVGVVLNQRVTLFSHAFYGYTPPPDWQFSLAPVPAPPT